MNLYVGNLPYRITEDQLRDAFAEFGEVSSCTIIKDKVTGQSKGFGFLEMPESSAGGVRDHPAERPGPDGAQDQRQRGAPAGQSPLGRP